MERGLSPWPRVVIRLSTHVGRRLVGKSGVTAGGLAGTPRWWAAWSQRVSDAGLKAQGH
jgi:hypothetical protein